VAAEEFGWRFIFKKNFIFTETTLLEISPQLDFCPGC